MRIILASASPRRKELLSAAGLRFEIRLSDADEKTITAGGKRTAIMRAALKAENVARLLKEETADDFIVIGADTVVLKEGKEYPKPTSEENAYEMLSELSGGSHSVCTGVALISRETGTSFVEETLVTFGRFDEELIKRYIDSGLCFGKAGAYGLQDEMLGPFIEKVDGSRENVIGLPTESVLEKIKEKESWQQWNWQSR